MNVIKNVCSKISSRIIYVTGSSFETLQLTLSFWIFLVKNVHAPWWNPTHLSPGKHILLIWCIFDWQHRFQPLKISICSSQNIACLQSIRIIILSLTSCQNLQSKQKSERSTVRKSLFYRIQWDKSKGGYLLVLCCRIAKQTVQPQSNESELLMV